MNKKTCIIVDDERLARVMLREMLYALPEVTILDDCASATLAKESIEKLRPDFILLDIKMPDQTGFELLEDLDFIPQVIFTTAYDEYALRAFQVDALDYLLKPFKAEDLTKAVQKIVASNVVGNEIQPLPEQLFIKDGDRCHFIKITEIIQFVSFGNYVKVHTASKAILAKRSLNDIEKRTTKDKFFRANRTVLFNVSKIEDVKMGQKGTVKVVLPDDQEVLLSERKSVLFREMMSI